MIGFKVNNELYEIHELSGNSANAIACLNSPRTIWSNVVYQLRKLMIIMCLMYPVMVCIFTQIYGSYHSCLLMEVELRCHLILKIQFLIPYQYPEDFHLVTVTKLLSM